MTGRGMRTIPAAAPSDAGAGDPSAPVLSNDGGCGISIKVYMHIQSTSTKRHLRRTDGPREAAVGEPAPCEKDGLGDRRGIPMSGLALLAPAHSSPCRGVF